MQQALLTTYPNPASNLHCTMYTTTVWQQVSSPWLGLQQAA